jgi:hypothetical protein
MCLWGVVGVDMEVAFGKRGTTSDGCSRVVIWRLVVGGIR